MLLLRIKSVAPHEENDGRSMGCSKRGFTRASSGTKPEKRMANLKTKRPFTAASVCATVVRTKGAPYRRKGAGEALTYTHTQGRPARTEQLTHRNCFRGARPA